MAKLKLQRVASHDVWGKSSGWVITRDDGMPLKLPNEQLLGEILKNLSRRMFQEVKVTQHGDAKNVVVLMPIGMSKELRSKWLAEVEKNTDLRNQ